MISKQVKDEHYIDEHLFKSYSPAYFTQLILSSARVYFKNNVVTMTTRWQTVYSALWLILFTYSFSLYIEHYTIDLYHKSIMMYIISMFGTAIPYVTYCLTNFINIYTQRENNVKIYMMLQKVERTLRLEKFGYYTDFAYRLNGSLIVLIIVGYLTGYSAHAFSILPNAIYSMFFGFGILTLYLDILLGASMIYFLLVRIRHFNGIVKNCINEYKGAKKKAKKLTLMKWVLSLVIPKVQRNCAMLRQDKWLGCLQDILKCYKILTELYSFTIFMLTLNVLIWTFLVIGGIMLGYRSGLYPLSALITLGVWAGSYYLILTIFAFISDRFIIEVANMKLLCIRLISCDYEGPFQKTACEMIRSIHYEKPEFVVYGIFVFDSRIPLEIIGVIASNILLVVQLIE